ncbi:MAG: hypothetical protein ACOYXT_28960 [Bacteroidota bacterium]
MLVRCLTIVLLIASACQSDRIACPEVKVAKLRNKPFKNFHTVTAKKAERETNNLQPVASRRETRPALEHVSVEEWDCPKPGMKKNIPKALKENIRKNMKKVRSYLKNKENTPDSVRTGYHLKR